MIKQICIWWSSFIVARRLRRILPKVVERRDTTLPVLRRQHKTTRHVIAMNYREVHEALRGPK